LGDVLARPRFCIHAGHQVRRDPVFDVKRRLVLQRAGAARCFAHMNAVVECVVVVEAESGYTLAPSKTQGSGKKPRNVSRL